MLRVTVTREQSDDQVVIGEVVVGKFAGTEQRGGYAARVHEPPSRYSNGIDACFTVRGHERYQPAMALVGSVLAAWREGRIDAVGEGVQTALLRASSRLDQAPIDDNSATVERCRSVLVPALAGEPALAGLVERVLALAAIALAGGQLPDAAILNAASDLLRDPSS